MGWRRWTTFIKLVNNLGCQELLQRAHKSPRDRYERDAHSWRRDSFLGRKYQDLVAVTKSHSHKVHKYNPEIGNDNKLVQQIPKKRIQVRIDLTLELGFKVASIPRWNQPYTFGRGNNLGNRARALVRALGPYGSSPFVSNDLHIQLVRNVFVLFDSSLDNNMVMRGNQTIHYGPHSSSRMEEFED